MFESENTEAVNKLKSMHNAKVDLALQALQDDKNDKEALWLLHITYQYGYGKYDVNEVKAGEYLQKAADNGHQDAICEINRKKARQEARKNIQKSDLALKESTNEEVKNLTTIHNAKVDLALQTLQENKSDKEALWILYVTYQYGYGKYDVNKVKAGEYLQKAADNGHKGAIYAINRRKYSQEARKNMQELDSAWEKSAKEMFDEKHKTELEKTIKKEIFPCMVYIETDFGICGTGFFYHDKWLVSNANILRGHADIESLTMVDNNGDECRLELGSKGVFNSNLNKKHIPNIVIANVKSRSNNNYKCMPKLTSDEYYKGGTINFYVYFDSETKKLKIQYVTKHRNKPTDIYECDDKAIPQPGCSGSPIIEARVIKGKTPTWKFKTVGVLCAVDSANKKLLHTTSMDHTFHEILAILKLTNIHNRDIQKFNMLTKFTDRNHTLPNDLPKGTESLALYPYVRKMEKNHHYVITNHLPFLIAKNLSENDAFLLFRTNKSNFFAILRFDIQGKLTDLVAKILNNAITTIQTDEIITVEPFGGNLEKVDLKNSICNAMNNHSDHKLSVEKKFIENIFHKSTYRAKWLQITETSFKNPITIIMEPISALPSKKSLYLNGQSLLEYGKSDVRIMQYMYSKRKLTVRNNNPSLTGV